MKKTAFIHLLSLVVWVLGLTYFLNPSVAYAATITVNTTTDELNSDGDCSLREAIRAANTNAIVDNCMAGSTGADVINLPAGNYLLTLPGAIEEVGLTGDLDVTDTNGSLTINGVHALNTTINGNDLDRVFDIFTGATVTLNNLTITNGQVSAASEDGGGIRIEYAFVTINRTIISNNQTTTDPSIDGGGIFFEDNDATLNNAFLVIDASAIVNNSSSDHGGGFYSTGATSTITIRNSTFSGNHAEDEGGGIFSQGSSSVLTLENTTIANNTAADLAGGLRRGSNNPTTVIKNTIIGDNSATTANPDCFAPATHTMTVNYSLIEDVTGCLISGANNQNGNPPNLAPLANNAGNTLTHALLPASVAINNGHTQNGGTAAGGCLDSTSVLVNVDQRGGARAQGANRGDGGCDIGAYEFNSTQTPTMVTLRQLNLNHSSERKWLIVGVVFLTILTSWLVMRRYPIFVSFFR